MALKLTAMGIRPGEDLRRQHDEGVAGGLFASRTCSWLPPALASMETGLVSVAEAAAHRFDVVTSLPSR